MALNAVKTNKFTEGEVLLEDRLRFAARDEIMYTPTGNVAGSVNDKIAQIAMILDYLNITYTSA
jgi:hypothetical protein